MKNLLQRIKNLWKLSLYEPSDVSNKIVLKKQVGTIEKKMATIVLPDKDILNEEIYDTTSE